MIALNPNKLQGAGLSTSILQSPDLMKQSRRNEKQTVASSLCIQAARTGCCCLGGKWVADTWGSSFWSVRGRKSKRRELMDSVPGEGAHLSSWAVLLLELHMVENDKTIVWGFFYKSCGLDPSLSKDPTF